MFPSSQPRHLRVPEGATDSSRRQLDELNEEHKATGKPLADVVVDLGIVEKDDLLRRIAAHLGYDYLQELPVQFPGEAIAALTGKLARDYGVMPLQADDQNIDLLVTDPFNTQAVDDLTFALIAMCGCFCRSRQGRDPDQAALRRGRGEHRRSAAGNQHGQSRD